MKKTITGMVTVMVLLATSAFGQNPVNQVGEVKTAKTYFTLMANMVSNNLDYGEADGSLAGYKKSARGLQAGASFQAGVTPAFSLVSELYYLKKGGKLEANNPLGNSASEIRLHTLEMPWLARVHFSRVYVNAGPALGYNLGGKRTVNEQSSGLSFSRANGGFRRFDAGIQAGGGIELPFRQKRIALDLRYSYGLSNIAYTGQLYNRAFMVSVNYSKAWRKNPLSK